MVLDYVRQINLDRPPSRQIDGLAGNHTPHRLSSIGKRGTRHGTTAAPVSLACQLACHECACCDGPPSALPIIEAILITTLQCSAAHVICRPHLLGEIAITAGFFL